MPPPAIVAAITVSLLCALGLSRQLRANVRAVGLRSFVAFHVVRVSAGAYFLVLYRRGTLPSEFAVTAGWGDIAVGITAAIVCVICFPIRHGWQPTTLLAWNVFGLIDIVFVLSSGVRLFLGEPTIMQSFTQLPLALLPTFVVPIVLVTHVLIFVWWRDARAARSDGPATNDLRA